jgi:hypothetical protein
MEQHTLVPNSTLHSSHMLQPYPKQETYRHALSLAHYNLCTNRRTYI